MDLDRYLRARRRLIDQALRAAVRPRRADRLNEAMRYGLLDGGKRLRPILTLAACESVGGDSTNALPFACAIEMIHAYSLMHDDLPAMDDDDMRRGRPSTHVVYGEALAILAGDALLTDAFALLAQRSTVPAKTNLTLIHEIARASGSAGMVSGQARDMGGEDAHTNVRKLETTHRRKTGALLRCAARAGALAGRGSAKQIDAITAFSEDLGLAFQIVDDLLDAEGSTATTGKRVGRDQVQGKATFPGLLGSEGSRKRVRALIERATNALADFDPRADPLRALAGHVIARLPAGRRDQSVPS